MRIYQFDRLSNGKSGSGSTLRLEQRFSHSHRRVRAAALAAAGTMICAPFVLILTNAAARGELLPLANQQPYAALQLAIAALLGAVALIFGLGELLQTVVRQRVIEINGQVAVVQDFGRRRTQRWQEPLTSFKGIRHRVQTRSSGPVHLLMLEHARPARSLCIAYETRIANQVIVEAGRRFDLPILTNTGNSSRSLLWARLLPLSLNWGRSTTTETQVAGT